MNNYPDRRVQLTDDAAREYLRKKSRRAFLVAGVAGTSATAAYFWLRSRPEEDMTPWPQRRVLRANEHLAHAYLNDGHLAPTYSASEIGHLKPNGDIGLDDDVDMDTWRLKVEHSGISTPG